MTNEAYHKRNLPHFYPKGATFFITFRLYNTIPKEILNEWQISFEQKRKAIEQSSMTDSEKEDKLDHLEKLYFVSYDNYLDNIDNLIDYLKQSQLAEVVRDALLYYDGKYYETLAYCIMSNHVHWVIDTSVQLQNSEYINLSEFLKLIKGYSARVCNKMLGTKGYFWQHESYDRVVRNEKELQNIINYVVNNPVKAGLVEDWTQWQYSYRI